MDRLKGRTSPYFFILPTIALIMFIYFIPLFETIIFSFMDMKQLGVVGEFVGLRNYENLFVNEEFRYSFALTVFWTFTSVGLIILVGLGLALALNEKFPGNKIVRTLSLIPWITPASICAVFWRWALHPAFGSLNFILKSLGVISGPLRFLSDPRLAIFTIILVRFWRGLPFAVFCFLAGLQSIPEELYEAAEIEGATGFYKFRYITLPLLRGVIAMTTTLLTIWTFQLFDIIFVLTGGGPFSSTEIIPIFIFLTLFRRYDINPALSGGVLVVTFLLIISFIYFKFFGRR